MVTCPRVGSLNRAQAKAAPGLLLPMDHTHVPVRRPLALLLLLLAAAVLVEFALYRIAAHTPPDMRLGIVQKIFYFHVGSAFAMSLALVAGAVFSVTDLVKPSDRVDALARSSIEVGVLFALIVLSSGPIWARKSWGAWWTWEPRLTLSLLITLLAISVLALRGMAPDSRTGRRIGAAMAIMAAPAAYLIHIAVEMWGGNHPTVLNGGGIQNSAMRISFWLSVVALLTFGALYRGIRLEQRLDGLRLTLSARNIRHSRAAAGSAETT